MCKLEEEIEKQSNEILKHKSTIKNLEGEKAKIKPL
jgi:hypothetical protein